MNQYKSNCGQVCTAYELENMEGINTFITEHGDDPNDVIRTMTTGKNKDQSIGLKNKAGEIAEFLGTGKPMLVRFTDGSYHAWMKPRFNTTFKLIK